MNNGELIGKGYPVCEPIMTFIRKLMDRGFIMIDNGDYTGDMDKRPNSQSLYFRLESPVDLNEIDIRDNTYYLAKFGENTYMCECHYHIIELISSVVVSEQQL